VDGERAPIGGRAFVLVRADAAYVAFLVLTHNHPDFIDGSPFSNPDNGLGRVCNRHLQLSATGGTTPLAFQSQEKAMASSIKRKWATH